MSRGLESYRASTGTTRAVIVSFLVFILSQAGIIWITRSLGSDFLGIQLTFSSEKFLQTALGWQSAGLMPVYYRHFSLDYTHPVFYGLFLSSFMALSFNLRAVAGRFNPLLVLPFLASFLDMAENTLHLYMLSDFSRITSWMVILSGTCTSLKWGICFLCFAGTAFLFIRRERRERA